MSDPVMDEEFWYLAAMSVLAEIRSDIHAMQLGIPASDDED